mmetsp:Transcript_7092/g.15254  ORF Transcript_7092/g.15254 Transcript_7092/m.15254 type:complete len:111 (-) Transcript_7092:33-365(-)
MLGLFRRRVGEYCLVFLTFSKGLCRRAACSAAWVYDADLAAGDFVGFFSPDFMSFFRGMVPTMCIGERDPLPQTGWRVAVLDRFSCSSSSVVFSVCVSWYLDVLRDTICK